MKYNFIQLNLSRIVLLQLVMLPVLGYCQQVFSDETFLEKLDLYRAANRANLLFVHTDKDIYTNNEDIWFSAYLLKSESIAPASHTITSVALVREGVKKVALQRNYLMQNGLSFGSLPLPDSLAPGKYQLLAFTNVTDHAGNPLAVFSQSITIKKHHRN